MLNVSDRTKVVIMMISFWMCLMKSLFLRLYLTASLVITTTAVGACFVWYIQEYDLAYKLDQEGSIERADIHRTNSLWLGLWGGIYGLGGIAAAGFLLSDYRKEKS